MTLNLLDDSLPEAVIQGSLTTYVFYRVEVFGLIPQPPTWRNRVFLLVWLIAFDPSGMGGPTGNMLPPTWLSGSFRHMSPTATTNGDNSRGRGIFAPTGTLNFNPSSIQSLY
jgi:hypothetical protein